MKLKSCCKQHNNRIDSTSRNSHDEWSLRFSRVSARGVKLISGFAKCHPIEKDSSGHTEKWGGHHKSRKIIITIMKGIIAEGMQQQATNASQQLSKTWEKLSQSVWCWCCTFENEFCPVWYLWHSVCCYVCWVWRSIYCAKVCFLVMCSVCIVVSYVGWWYDPW